MAMVSSSEVRDQFASYLDKCSQEPIIILRGSKPAAVLLAANEYRKLLELKRLIQNPHRLSRLLNAVDEIASGDLSKVSPLQLEQAVARATGAR